MRKWAIALLLAVSSFAAQAQTPIYCKRDVIRAMNDIWMESRDGTSGEEAAFALNGRPQRYVIYHEPHTGQKNYQDIYTYDNTFAVVHVHPNGDGGIRNAFPSTPDDNSMDNGLGDTGAADQGHFDMYVVSQWG